MATDRIQTWDDFWPFYLGEHRVPLCRWLHVTGTTTGGFLALFAVVTGTWWLLLPAVVVGYASSWTGHFFVEGNKPASFRYPLWSFLADWKMLALFWTFRLDREVVRLFGDRHPSLEDVAAVV